MFNSIFSYEKQCISVRKGKPITIEEVLRSAKLSYNRDVKRSWIRYQIAIEGKIGSKVNRQVPIYAIITPLGDLSLYKVKTIIRLSTRTFDVIIRTANSPQTNGPRTNGHLANGPSWSLKGITSQITLKR